MSGRVSEVCTAAPLPPWWCAAEADFGREPCAPAATSPLASRNCTNVRDKTTQPSNGGCCRYLVPFASAGRRRAARFGLRQRRPNTRPNVKRIRVSTVSQHDHDHREIGCTHLAWSKTPWLRGSAVVGVNPVLHPDRQRK